MKCDTMLVRERHDVDPNGPAPALEVTRMATHTIFGMAVCSSETFAVQTNGIAPASMRCSARLSCYPFTAVMLSWGAGNGWSWLNWIIPSLVSSLCVSPALLPWEPARGRGRRI